MFEIVSDLHGSGINPAEHLKSEILQHLHALEEELKRYFPDMLDEKEISLARNLFASQLDISKISDDLQDELLEMIPLHMISSWKNLSLNFGFLCNSHMQRSV